MKLHWKSLSETEDAAHQLAKLLKPGDILPLIGPLGAGKTTFVRFLAEGLKVGKEYPVTSPTFVYCQIYPGRIPLYHMDFYRIENQKHLSTLGLHEMIGGEGVSAIEWYDRFPEIGGEDRLEIQFDPKPTGERIITVQAKGSRSSQLLKEWSK